MKKYQSTFEFVDTEAQAAALCNRINAGYTPYMRKHHPATFTPWESLDNKTSKFVVFYKY